MKTILSGIEFDITEYCNAAVDACYDYCIEEFKKACDKAGITWDKTWEKILYD